MQEVLRPCILGHVSYSGGLGAVISVSIADVPQGVGVIQSKSGYRYQMTPDDMLWLARSTEAEGGTAPAATIWTYAQRQVAASRTGSLADLVRSHSQPMNPIWSSPTGSGCVRDPSKCTPALIARRLAAQAKPWSSIASGIREKVVRFATGLLPNPVPSAVDFAAPSTAQSWLSRNPGSRVVLQAGNWYVATAPSSRWPADQVTINYDGRVAGGAALATGLGAIAVVAIIGGGALLALGLWKRSRTRRKLAA